MHDVDLGKAALRIVVFLSNGNSNKNTSENELNIIQTNLLKCFNFSAKFAPID